ncbi:MAG: hypothetical protein ABSH21_08185 [Verrucomicrobiia bacterium]
MGLLAQANGASDYEAAINVASQVATLWNEYGGQQHGFQIEAGKAEIIRCCDRGTALLDAYFYRPPSPFKRVAAFCVLARIQPFFQLRPKPPTAPSNAEWLARICALLIPTTLAILHVNTAKSDEPPHWVNLDKWKGFPSPHVKMDFVSWLQWLDNFDYLSKPESTTQEDWEIILDERAGRMILSTALMIEAFYYINEGCPFPPSVNHLRGKCRACLDKTDDLTTLVYDGLLFKQYHDKHPG